MSVSQCPKCGKYLHRSECCYHCGASLAGVTFAQPQMHENADVYNLILENMEKRQFSEALKLLAVVIEWMPDFAQAYWLKLLAKNQCRNGAELIAKGFDCDADGDFYHALTRSEGPEHQEVQEIGQLVRTVRAGLLAAVDRHEREAIVGTNVIAIQEQMHSILKEKRETLFHLWTELQETEQTMVVTSQDCALLLQEHQNALEKAEKDALELKERAYCLSECEAHQLQEYQIHLGGIRQRSEKALGMLQDILRNHPWVKTLSQKKNDHRELEKQISDALADLRRYKASLAETVRTVEALQERYAQVRQKTEAFDFQAVCTLLGTEQFRRILTDAGLKYPG